MPESRLKLKAPPDFDLRATVLAHGWKSLAPFDWDDQASRLTAVAHCGREPAVLRIEQAGRTVVVAVEAAVGRRGMVKQAARAATWMLCLDEDLSAFHAFCEGLKELRHIPANRQGRLLRSPTLFEDAVKTILTTNTTWAQTKAMARRLVDAYGTRAAPGARAFPRPEAIAGAPLEEFAERARLGYRNRYVYELARLVAAREVDLEALARSALTSEELIKELLKLPGLGPYGAAHLANLMGRYGAIPCDSWARTLVSRYLTGGAPVSDADVRRFFARYEPWPFLVYRFYRWDGVQEQAKALQW